MLRVNVDASRTNRSLVSASARRPQLKAEPALKFWRWLINSAVADAKRTKYGLPTDNAILQRCWIEHKAVETDREDWERSFDAACQWLGVDAAAERKRVLDEIDEALTTACLSHAQSVNYQRRAVVLSCAGVPTRVGRHFVLNLVSLEDYENVAGIDHPDPPARKSKRRQMQLI